METPSVVTPGVISDITRSDMSDLIVSSPTESFCCALDSEQFWNILSAVADDTYSPGTIDRLNATAFGPRGALLEEPPLFAAHDRRLQALLRETDRRSRQ